jgi:hypothetical protein
MRKAGDGALAVFRKVHVGEYLCSSSQFEISSGSLHLYKETPAFASKVAIAAKKQRARWELFMSISLVGGENRSHELIGNAIENFRAAPVNLSRSPEKISAKSIKYALGEILLHLGSDRFWPISTCHGQPVGIVFYLSKLLPRSWKGASVEK